MTKVEVARPQKFGAHHPDQTHPAKQQQQAEQPPEIRLHHAGEDDQQIEQRQALPDLDKALEEQVHPAAEIPLHRARGNADRRAEQRQQQAKEHGDAVAVEHARHHVARLVVRAEPVFSVGRGRSRLLEVVVDRVVAIGHQRPQDPALFLD